MNQGLEDERRYIPKATDPVYRLDLEGDPIAVMNVVPRGPNSGVRVAGDEALFESLGLGGVAGDGGAQSANE